MALSLRDFIVVQEQRGRLRRVSREVDRMWEPACLAKWMFQALPEDRRFGMLFENVAGSDMALATGLLGASTEAYATALGVAPEEINQKWVAALLNPVAPVEVRSAPCQEVVLTGKDASLRTLPIPVWTPGKDAGPYITTCVVTKNAGTGNQNIGVYRTQVRDDHSVVINLVPNGQGRRSSESYIKDGRPAPIAWVVGADPAIILAAVANLPYGLDEAYAAGGLAGQPIEYVKAKTVDLMVPANAEIVIEGEVVPGEIGMEGPFGEFAGYMGPVGERPVARITAITHRNKPIYYAFTSQMPPSESTTMQSLTNAGVILKMLRHDLGETSVEDVFIDLTYGGMLAHAIIAMKPRSPGHGKRIGRLVADMAFALKRVTVVDTDIDIRDPLHVDWAINSRYNPATDTIILNEVNFGNMDPSVRPVEGRPGLGSQLILDATQRIDSGPFSLPGKDYMMKALAVWEEIGFPKFATPKRAKLRIDHS